MNGGASTTSTDGEPGPPPDGRFVAIGFGLGVVHGTPTYVARGELGHVWKLVTSDGEWAVKQLRLPVDENTGGDLGFQLAVLEAGGVPLPRPMVTADGSPILVDPTTGVGHRVYEWVDHVPGRSVEPAVAGALLARIHAVGHPADFVDPWFYDPVPEAEWRSYAHRIPGQTSRLDDIVETLAWTTGSPPVNRLIACHLDFGSDNVLLDRSGSPWVIDWENSGAGDPDQELAQAAVFFGGGDPAASVAVLAGYRAAGGPGRLRGLESFAMTFAVQANFLGLCVRERRAAAVERLLQTLVTVDAARRILAADGA